MCADNFRIGVITLIPQIWQLLLSRASGVVGAACERGRVETQICDLRQYGVGVHRQVDDTPYGGGAGMILQVGPLLEAIEHMRAWAPEAQVVLLSPGGEVFCQQQAHSWAASSGVIFVCGRYEGVDARILEHVDAEISWGEMVLSAGDPAAWSMLDAVVRLRPGVLGNTASLEQESFADGLLEYPQYTRPADFRGARVPDVLLSGDHGRIAQWRLEKSHQRTLTRSAKR